MLTRQIPQVVLDRISLTNLTSCQRSTIHWTGGQAPYTVSGETAALAEAAEDEADAACNQSTGIRMSEMASSTTSSGRSSAQ